MRDRLYPHCLFHSFRRRWTLFARPILSRILAGCRLEPGLRLAVSAAANEAMTSLGRRCPVPGRVGATGGGAKRERAASAGGADCCASGVSQNMLMYPGSSSREMGLASSDI